MSVVAVLILTILTLTVFWVDIAEKRRQFLDESHNLESHNGKTHTDNE